MTIAHSTFFKALSTPSRVQILKLLTEHDNLTVDDLAGKLSITVPTVSRHLQFMRLLNLVTFEQDAQVRYYSVNEKEITQRFAAFLRDLSISPTEA